MPLSTNLISRPTINLASVAKESIKLAINSAPHLVGVNPCLINPLTNPVSFTLPAEEMKLFSPILS